MAERVRQSEANVPRVIDRRRFMTAAGVTTLAAMAGVSCAGDPSPDQASGSDTAHRAAGGDARGNAAPSAFAFDEATITSLQEQMQRGTLTSKALTEALPRTHRGHRCAGPTLRAVLETNPDALSIAAERDAERKAASVDRCTAFPCW